MYLYKLYGELASARTETALRGYSYDTNRRISYED